MVRQTLGAGVRGGHAKYVGRVGALALALGVGAAVITTPGVAWANTGETANESGTGGPTGVAGTAPGSGTGTTTDAGTGTGPGSRDGRGSLIRSVVAAALGDLPPSTLRIRSHRPIVKDEDAATSVMTTTVTQNDAPAAADHPANPFAGTGGTPAGRLLRAVTAARKGIVAESRGADPAAGTPVARLSGPNTPSGPPATFAMPDPSTLVVHPVTATPVSLPAPRPAAALAALPGAFLGTAAGLLSGLLNPGLVGGGPSAPVDTPVLWAVLAFVRRQFVNQAPTLNPTPTGTDPNTGQVYGNVGPADADGDPVSVSVVSNPDHGAVEIDSATGDYVYTPTAGYSGTDTFTVAVTDSGPDGVFGFLKPARGHTTLTAITITVDPANAPPTGSASPTAPDSNTGTLTVTVTARDPEGGAVTITPPVTTGTLTQTGSSTVAGVTTTTYAYTPSQPARDAAALTPGADTAPLVFTVSDAAGATALLTATVTIAPTPLVNPTNPVTIDPVTDTATGRVTGHVNASAAATGYTVTGLPAHGTLELNPDGSFTYTPYPVDRVRANNTVDTADDVDSFTITVSDGTTSTNVVVGVPLTPQATALAHRISGSQTPSGPVVVDPNTGTAYQTVEAYDAATGKLTTRVTTITPTGTTTSVVDGGPIGSVVVDPNTGTAYQMTQAYDATTGRNISWVAVITTAGTTSSILPGIQEGPVVVDPKTGAAYVTTSEGSTTWVTVITSAGIAERVVAGEAIGTVVVDPETGTAYQTTSTGGNTRVAVITTAGTTISPVDGYPVGSVVVDPKTGTVYQTTYSNILVITPAATSTIPLTGFPIGSVVIDPVTGTAYQSTNPSDATLGSYTTRGDHHAHRHYHQQPRSRHARTSRVGDRPQDGHRLPDHLRQERRRRGRHPGGGDHGHRRHHGQHRGGLASRNDSGSGGVGFGGGRFGHRHRLPNDIWQGRRWQGRHPSLGDHAHRHHHQHRRGQGQHPGGNRPETGTAYQTTWVPDTAPAWAPQGFW